MGFITEKAISRLKDIHKQAKINCTSNTDEQAIETRTLYPDWETDFKEGDSLEEGERVNYKEILYKVLQSHQKQANWNPIDAPSLFAKVLIPDENTIPEWEQPDSTNPYMKGDQVTHNSKTWESLIDNNVWEPGAVGTESLWKVVIE
jgi:hypothetical protein